MLLLVMIAELFKSIANQCLVLTPTLALNDLCGGMFIPPGNSTADCAERKLQRTAPDWKV